MQHNNVYKPVWAEGLMLSQQHLQLFDQYQQSQLAGVQQSLRDNAYGLDRIVFDESALAKGVVKLQSIAAIFKSGRHIHHVFADNEAPMFELEDNKSEYIISVALANNHSVSNIQGYPQTGQLSAYDCDFVELQDAHDPNRKAEVMVAKPKLMLVEFSASNSFIEQLPCIKVIRGEHGQFEIDSSYIPPLLNIKAHGYLAERVNKLVNMVEAKYTAMFTNRASMGIVEDFGPTELKHFLLLQTFSSVFPEIKQLSTTAKTSPDALFMALNKLVCQLINFEPEASKFELPVYDHQDLTRSFGLIESHIQTLIGSISAARSSDLVLSAISQSIFEVKDIESSTLTRGELYIAAFYENESTQWIELFAEQVKLAAPSQLEILIASALGGVKLTHCQRPPNRVSVKGGYEYFKVEPHGAAWEQVVQELALRIFVPFSLQGVKLEVVSVASK
ncbi:MULTISPECIES: type VI secretion system baseplate subunit TssK [Pseudoalteromonas]|uniref:type VI secretion system baseplate subunit TssK n=1 Tax=Pseudoalteromonas TaxID=53246 RepID=UPI0019D21FC4|nr:MULTISPECIES: type VI secretion system baseplate subunit TssK [Pseudoalteromonas]MBR8845153.1 type VI secretion system baseplate subunit TssK [Pseudoalteromonas sp. JC3]UDM61626.1 type VI secretion system baseplate subunit TssK [Pseudoalteromonas piscicida]WJE07191.1 type VI secretion system baseplate subunit TssK [Pseudoalteromonas sp. JC3]